MKYTSPLINVNQVTNEYLNFTNFNHKLPIIVRLTDAYGNPLINSERIYNTDFVWITTTLEEGNVIQHYNVLPTSKCNLTKHIPLDYQELYNSIKNLNSYYCTDWDNNQYDIYGIYGSNSLYTIGGITIQQCDTTMPNNKCLPQNEIDKILTFPFMEFITVDNQLSSNGIIPFSPSLYYYRNTMSNQSKLRVLLGIQQIDYTTDFGIIFEDKQTISSFKTTYIKETVNNVLRENVISGQEQLGIISFQNDSTYFYYTRSYMKAQQLLANIGGFVKGILILVEIIYFILGNKMFILSLSKHLSLFKRSQIFKIENTEIDFIKKINDITNDKTIRKINNLTIQDNLFKNYLEKGFEYTKQKLKLTWYEKYLPICFCKSKEIKLYEKISYLIQNELSAANIFRIGTSCEIISSLLISKNQIDLYEFLQLTSTVLNEKQKGELSIQIEKCLKSIENINSKIRSQTEENLLSLISSIK